MLFKVLFAAMLAAVSATYSLDQCRKIGSDLVGKFKTGSECAMAVEKYLFYAGNNTDSCPTAKLMKDCTAQIQSDWDARPSECLPVWRGSLCAFSTSGLGDDISAPAPAAGQPKECKTVLQVLDNANDGQFDTFLAVLKDSFMQGYLETSQWSGTLFAPLNEAFDNMFGSYNMSASDLPLAFNRILRPLVMSHMVQPMSLLELSSNRTLSTMLPSNSVRVSGDTMTVLPMHQQQPVALPFVPTLMDSEPLLACNAVIWPLGEFPLIGAQLLQELNSPVTVMSQSV